MERIREIISYIQGIETSNIIDLIIAIAMVILCLVVSPPITYIFLRIFYKKENKDEIKKSPIYKTLRTFFNILGIYISSKILNLSIEQDLFIDKLMRIVVIWTVANVVCGMLELNQTIVDKLREKKKIKISQNDKFMVLLISKIVKYILYISATYITLKEFGYDLGGLATGLGIGGAIIALAAQNLVKQLLAGLAIISDKPFEIGDSIEVVKGGNKTSGTVIGVTWRSTRLKTPQDTIITIDNGVIIDSNIVNWGKIKKRIYSSELHLALETDEQIVEKVINRIKFILTYDTNIITKSIRVVLKEIERDYLTISINAETPIIKYNDYVTFCSKLNLTILNILETQGVSLAYPGRNVYLRENKKALPRKKTVEHFETRGRRRYIKRKRRTSKRRSCQKNKSEKKKKIEVPLIT